MPAISRPPGTTPSSRTIARGVKRTKRRADRAASTCAAFEMRATGASLQQVANALFKGDKSNAYRSIKSEIVARGPNKETVDEVRDITIATLDEMKLASYPTAIDPDADPADRSRAIGDILKIEAERSELLGLYAPKKTETKGEIDVTVNRMADAADAVRKKLAGLDK